MNTSWFEVWRGYRRVMWEVSTAENSPAACACCFPKQILARARDLCSNRGHDESPREARGFANARGEEIDEFVLTLDR